MFFLKQHLLARLLDANRSLRDLVDAPQGNGRKRVVRVSATGLSLDLLKGSEGARQNAGAKTAMLDGKNQGSG
jgi:hypothetical protein